MEDEFEIFTLKHAFAAVLVIALGWGMAWNSGHVAKLAWNNLRPGKVMLTPYRSIAGAGEALAITSIATSPSPSVSPTSSTSLTIMIGGDVMMDRKVRLLGEQNGYASLLTDIAPLFKRADIAVINLEGPITSNRSKTLLPDKSTTKSFTFTFAPKTAAALATSGVTVVNLANNHTDNFGLAGLNETKKWLSAAGIKWFGSPWNGTSTEAVITKNGMTVAFVGYHAFQKGFDRAVESVRQLSAKGYFVIVMPHWGEEYVTMSTPDLKTKARTLVAAGADAIIGSHSHVVMDYAWMGDVPVFYSLGNLLFDQYFSPEVMKGNIVELRLIKSENGAIIDSLKVYETSTASRKGVTLEGEKR